MSSLESDPAEITSATLEDPGFVGPDLLALRTRRIRLSTFDQPALTHAAALLMTMDGQSAAPVDVEIGGSGQDIDAALQLLDVLDAMHAPVLCSCSLMASGTAAAILGAHPGRRTIKNRAAITMRIAAATTPRGLVAADLTLAAAVAKRSRTALASAVARQSGQPIKWVLGQFQNGALLDAPEALALGLFDELAEGRHFEVATCEDCHTLPVSFRNTREHQLGLEEGESYRAE